MSCELIDKVNEYDPGAGHAGLWWLGQASFILKTGGWIIYIDPFFSVFPDRLVSPLFPADDVTNAGLILGSHDHVDHIDRRCWPVFANASPEARFIVPAPVKDGVVKSTGIEESKIIGISENRDFAEGELRISAIPAAHEFIERDKNGDPKAVGFIIECGGLRIFHSGDTLIYDGMAPALKKSGKIDAMLIPINGRSGERYRKHIMGNMTYQEAVDLAGYVNPGIAVPMHFDAFRGNTENPQLFADYMDAKYPEIKYVVPKYGELITL